MPTHAIQPISADLAMVSTREAAVAVCAAIETTMESLLQLIEAESVLLRAGKTVAAAALDARKNDFAAAYLNDLAVLREVGPELEALAPDAVDRLRRLHEEFVSVLQIDMAALATARAAAEPLPTRLPNGRGPIADGRPLPRLDRIGRHIPQRLASSSRR
ncbi:hypothetical protein LB518_14995 [Mesorhizobium sp. BR1-1-16]|uniref:hypothetical protein n=1 Tax=Mesorhizobium sp. BR1-1-16 TaxID=2876653 RepID=UPI001CCF4948|nr:hypothetical protein [Mesorhizobium sp. BR1-1-16]MBZ9937609.1 hypothetical protein [Mesorhizobium sp. BR1-1-16]